MSLFKKIGKALRPLGGIIKQAVGSTPLGAAALQLREVVRSAPKAPPSADRFSAYEPIERVNISSPRSSLVFTPRAAAAAPRSMNAINLVNRGFSANRPTMSILPALIRGASTVLPGAGAVGRVAGRVATVGGAVATGAVLYDQFGNQVRKRRARSKGITARELKSFTRVTSILNKYCKTPPPMKRRRTGSKACR